MTSIGHLDQYRKTAAQAAVVLLAAWAMKAFYSNASVNELRWILCPTKTFVEWITGTRFYFESFAGYMSEDRSFVIAAACSGVNFLIAVFMMLSLRRLWTLRLDGVAWLSIVWVAVLSYFVAVGANALRISSALWLNSNPHEFAGMDREELHRLDGIMIYFGVMLIVYLAFERIAAGRNVRGWGSYLLPLVVYYTVTLAVPMANGAWRDDGFVRHAAIVLVTPVLSIGAFIVAGSILLFDRHGEGGTSASALFPGDPGADQAGAGTNV